jgi:hypothetical protein
MQASSPTTTIYASDIALGFRKFVQPWMGWAVAALAVVSVNQMNAGNEDVSATRTLLVAGFSGPILLSFSMWCRRAGPCLPILPFVLLTYWMAYGFPILVQSPAELPDIQLELISPSLFIWPMALLLGWFIVPSQWIRTEPQPTMLGIGEKSIFLPHILVGSSFALILLIGSPLYWEGLGSSIGASFYNVFNTIANLMIMPGTFIGAYRWSRGRLKQPSIFWVIVALMFTNYLLSFLLSAAQNLVLGALLGLWIGRSKQALTLTLTMVLILAFLHPGKFAMRDKYGTDGFDKNNKPSPPELLVEWIGYSYDKLFTAKKEDDQNLQQRISNIGILTFAVQQIELGTQPLNGATYALIPQVIVPRIFNETKVRSQEGQVLLNLQFGRQASREATETTYITWGPLAESIGNFGPWVGPLVVGVAMGALIRISELLGAGQELLSKPGLQSLVMMVLWIGSFEQVASTFFAAAFQTLILIEVITRLLLTYQKKAINAQTRLR